VRRKRPSRTASKVAEVVWYLSTDPELAPLLPEGSADWTMRLLQHLGRLRPWQQRLARKPWYRRFVDWAERSMVPGQILHLALRKRFLDEEIRALIARGTEQVLVVGGGFDTLCIRLAEQFPDTTFLELDHPVTHRAKRDAVEDLGGARDNLHLHGVDLSTTALDEALRSIEAWRPGARSAVVAEGVLMYVEPEAVAKFLDATRRCTGPDSRLLFTYLVVDKEGRPALGRLPRLMSVSLKLTGEPIYWGIEPGTLARFLKARGFHLLANVEQSDLRSAYLEPRGLGDRPLGEIERLAMARRED
jgi:methyltransferase (TIGR00027 family)